MTCDIPEQDLTIRLKSFRTVPSQSTASGPQHARGGWAWSYPA